jgi:hypothetical protein
MFCTQCGRKATTDDRSCGGCGSALVPVAAFNLPKATSQVVVSVPTESKPPDSFSAASHRVLWVLGGLVLLWAALILVIASFSISNFAAVLLCVAFGVGLIKEDRRVVAFGWVLVGVGGMVVLARGVVPVALLGWFGFVALQLYAQRRLSQSAFTSVAAPAVELQKQTSPPAAATSPWSGRVGLFTIVFIIIAGVVATLFWGIASRRSDRAADDSYKRWLTELRGAAQQQTALMADKPNTGTETNTNISEDFEASLKEDRTLLRDVNRVWVSGALTIRADGSIDAAFDEAVTANAQQRLTSLGVSVVPPPGATGDPGAYQFAFDISRQSVGANLMMFVRADITEPARLVRHPQILRPVEVWHATSRIEICSEPEAVSTANILITELINQFVAARAAANKVNRPLLPAECGL